jgi:hypothetical protein
MCAVTADHPEVVKVLVSHGANIDSLSVASEEESGELERLTNLFNMQLLTGEEFAAAKAMLNVATALHVAVDAGNASMVRLLVSLGASVEIRAGRSNATVTEMINQAAAESPGAKDELSAGAAPLDGPLEVGDKIVLTPDYLEVDEEAQAGPLTPGMVGELICDDGSDKPFQVIAGGVEWWYSRRALQRANEEGFKRVPSMLTFDDLDVQGADQPEVTPECISAVKEGSLLRELREAGGGPVLDWFRNSAEALLSTDLRLSASHTMRNAGTDPLGFHYSQSENSTGRASPIVKQDTVFEAEQAGTEVLLYAMKDLVQREAALLFLALSEKPSDRPGDDTRLAIQIAAPEQLDALWISSQRALACDLGADVSKTQLTNMYTDLIETQPQAAGILLGRAVHDLANNDHAAGGSRATPKFNGAGKQVRLGTSDAETLAGLKGSSLFYCGCKYAEPGELPWSPSGVCAELERRDSDSVSVPCAACVQLLADIGRIGLSPKVQLVVAKPTFSLSRLVVALGIQSLSKENETLAVQLSFALFASCVQVERVGQQHAEWAATQLSRIVNSHKDALASPVWAPFNAAANGMLPRLLTAIYAAESAVVPRRALMHSLFLQSLIEVAVLVGVPWQDSSGSPQPVMKIFERMGSVQSASGWTAEVRIKLLELAALIATRTLPVGMPTNRAGDAVNKGGQRGGTGGWTGRNPLELWYCGQRKNQCKCGMCDGRCGPSNGCPCDDCFALLTVDAMPTNRAGDAVKGSDASLPEGFEALAHVPAPELRRRLDDIEFVSTALASGTFSQLSLCTAGSLCHDLLVRHSHELLLPEVKKNALDEVIRRTNSTSDVHGPEIELNRMNHMVAESPENKTTLFAQACIQLLPRIRGEASDLLHARAWKVRFIGEGTSHESEPSSTTAMHSLYLVSNCHKHNQPASRLLC